MVNMKQLRFHQKQQKVQKVFLIFDRALGFDTHILYSKEISEEDHNSLRTQLRK